jgi:hypothetical protein
VRPAWGAVAVGAMAGLGMAAVLVIVLTIAGSRGSPTGDAVLVFVQFLALVAAGYVAGRLAPDVPVYHGGLAGIVVFTVSTTISLAGGADIGVVPLLVLAFTGVVLGSAGGVLSDLTGGN